MIISSPSFKFGTPIPKKFTCEGEDVNPKIVIQNIPKGAESFVLVFEDIDASAGGIFIHWLVYDIPPISIIHENSVPGIQGINSFMSNGYGGPCPKSGKHRYYFKLYALDKYLNFEEGRDIKDIENEMEGH